MIRPVAACLAVLIRDGRILLVRRRNPPDAGLWGFPGGKIEAGETIRHAAIRELREETGIEGEALDHLTPIDLLRRDATGALIDHFILLPILCRWRFGTAVAASDAQDARWFAIAALGEHETMLSGGVTDLAHQALQTWSGFKPGVMQCREIE